MSNKKVDYQLHYSCDSIESHSTLQITIETRLAAMTTLPTLTTEDYLYGSHGNDATCSAQGFFIQVGTVAAYMNISLAFYYYLAITRGMNEERLRSYRLCFFLCPMILGMTFAFAGK